MSQLSERRPIKAPAFRSFWHKTVETGEICKTKGENSTSSVQKLKLGVGGNGVVGMCISVLIDGAMSLKRS